MPTARCQNLKAGGKQYEQWWLDRCNDRASVFNNEVSKWAKVSPGIEVIPHPGIVQQVRRTIMAPDGIHLGFSGVDMLARDIVKAVQEVSTHKIIDLVECSSTINLADFGEFPPLPESTQLLVLPTKPTKVPQPTSPTSAPQTITGPNTKSIPTPAGQQSTGPTTKPTHSPQTSTRRQHRRPVKRQTRKGKPSRQHTCRLPMTIAELRAKGYTIIDNVGVRNHLVGGYKKKTLEERVRPNPHTCKSRVI